MYIPHRIIWITKYNNCYNCSLHYIDLNNDYKCSICLEEINENDEIGIFQFCPHIYHFNCINQWCTISNSCPLCKQNVDFIYISNNHLISVIKLNNKKPDISMYIKYI